MSGQSALLTAKPASLFLTTIYLLTGTGTHLYTFENQLVNVAVACAGGEVVKGHAYQLQNVCLQKFHPELGAALKGERQTQE